MERRDGFSNICLDAVAGVVAARRIELEARGLAVAQPTWMDLDAPWPAPLVTDRTEIGCARSIGVQLCGPAGAEGLIVVYAGGWADIDYVLPGGDVLKSEYVELDDAGEFEPLFMRVCTSLLQAGSGQP
jgi:hypothetical protein